MRWANAWVRYFTGGAGNFMIAAMEDTGTMQALTFLSNAGRIDLKRVLVLRTVSNYDREAPGSTAAESLKGLVTGTLFGLSPGARCGSDGRRYGGSLPWWSIGSSAPRPFHIDRRPTAASRNRTECRPPRPPNTACRPARK